MNSKIYISNLQSTATALQFSGQSSSFTMSMQEESLKHKLHDELSLEHARRNLFEEILEACVCLQENKKGENRGEKMSC